MENSEMTSFLLLSIVRDHERTVGEVANSIRAALTTVQRRDNRVLFVLPWGMRIVDVFDAFRGRGWLEITPANGKPARYLATNRGRAVLEAAMPKLKEHFGFDPAQL